MEKINNEGENIGWIAPVKPKCTKAGQKNCYSCGDIVDHWYNEMKTYDFAKGKSSSNKPVHHFGQVNAFSAINNFYGINLNYEEVL